MSCTELNGLPTQYPGMTKSHHLQSLEQPSAQLLSQPLGRLNTTTNGATIFPLITNLPETNPVSQPAELPGSGPIVLSSVGSQSTNSYCTVSRHNTASVSEQFTGHHNTVSHVGYVCQQCEGSHLSQTATNLIIASWRDKSNKSNNSSFSKWTNRYGEQNRSPFLGPISDVANFLAELYEQGLLNTYHLAISSTNKKS